MIECRCVCDRCKRDSLEGNLTVMGRMGPEIHLCTGCAMEFNEWLKTPSKYNLSFPTAIMEMVIKKAECESEIKDLFRYDYDSDEFQWYDKHAVPPRWADIEPDEGMQDLKWRVVNYPPTKMHNLNGSGSPMSDCRINRKK